MSASREITITNRPEDRAIVLDALERFFGEHELPSRALHELQLAVEEHLTNICSYGFADDAAHTIIARIALVRGAVCVEVEDDGRAFNPLSHPAPDLALSIDERPIGGLGIHMIRKSVDALEYRRERDRNVLMMRKNIAP
jgi:anti-sigma regulatory factor (Ser/Thr protein kinase)